MRRGLIALGALLGMLVLVFWFVVTKALDAQERSSEPEPRVVITYVGTQGTVDGADVKVTVWTNVALVPPERAREPDDLHLAFLLDADVTPYYRLEALPIPASGPKVIHTADTSVTFRGVAPGTHLVAVVLSDPDHWPVRPPSSYGHVEVRAGETRIQYRYYDEDSFKQKLPPALILAGLLGAATALAFRRRQADLRA